MPVWVQLALSIVMVVAPAGFLGGEIARVHRGEGSVEWACILGVTMLVGFVWLQAVTL